MKNGQKLKSMRNKINDKYEASPLIPVHSQKQLAKKSIFEENVKNNKEINKFNSNLHLKHINSDKYNFKR